jgi:hypothetical protein
MNYSPRVPQMRAMCVARIVTVAARIVMFRLRFYNAFARFGNFHLEEIAWRKKSPQR